MAMYNQRPVDQPKRGRKPVREDIYISTSLAKIEEMEQRLQNERSSLTTKQRDELRNKASALRSRVNRKLEHRTQVDKLDKFNKNFETLSSIMINEMDKETRDRVMAQFLVMSSASSKSVAANKSGRKASTSRANNSANTVSGTSTKDLLKKLKELIESDGGTF